MNTTTRCKFRCNEVLKTESGSNVTPFTYHVKFTPVTQGSKENELFFAWTPSGLLTLTVKQDLFVPGKEYFLDISLAVPVEA